MGSGGSKETLNQHLLETFPDHTDAINTIALSEDGSLLVTGSEDHTARMWSTKTEQTECLGVLVGHESYITCITVSDTFILTGSADETIRKWDMTTCECLNIFRGHTSKINRVICTGEFVFSTSSDRTAKAWLFNLEDVEGEHIDGLCLRTFKEHTKAVIPIVFIPSENTDGLDEEGLNINPGDLLITGSNDGQARSWSFDTGACLKVFKGHRGPITCMDTDPFGKMLYTGSFDHTIRCWVIATGECRKVLEGHSGSILCLSVVNKLMYSGGADSQVMCWVREFGDCTREYKGHNHSVTNLIFKDGILYTACGDAIARAYDARSGAIKREFRGPERAINCLTVCLNKLYTADAEGVLRVWDTEGLSDGVVPNPEDLADDDAPIITEKSNRQLDDLDKRLNGYMMEPEPSKSPDLPGGVRSQSPEFDDELIALERELKV